MRRFCRSVGKCRLASVGQAVFNDNLRRSRQHADDQALCLLGDIGELDRLAGRLALPRKMPDALDDITRPLGLPGNFGRGFGDGFRGQIPAFLATQHRPRVGAYGGQRLIDFMGQIAR